MQSKFIERAERLRDVMANYGLEPCSSWSSASY